MRVHVAAELCELQLGSIVILMTACSFKILSNSWYRRIFKQCLEKGPGGKSGVLSLQPPTLNQTIKKKERKASLAWAWKAAQSTKIIIQLLQNDRKLFHIINPTLSMKEMRRVKGWLVTERWRSKRKSGLASGGGRDVTSILLAEALRPQQAALRQSRLAGVGEPKDLTVAGRLLARLARAS